MLADGQRASARERAAAPIAGQFELVLVVDHLGERRAQGFLGQVTVRHLRELRVDGDLFHGGRDPLLRLQSGAWAKVYVGSMAAAQLRYEQRTTDAR